MSRLASAIACAVLLCGPLHVQAAGSPGRAGGVLGELQRADARLGRLREEQKCLAAEIARLRRAARRHRRREERWRARRESLRVAGAARLRGLSHLWRLGSVWAYLRADRPVRLVRLQRYLRVAVEEDLRLLGALAAAGEALRAEKRRIARVVRELGTRQAKLRAAVARLEAQRESKRLLVERARRNRRTRKVLARELRTAARRVDRALARMGRGSPGRGPASGLIRLPVSGPVLSRFGAPLVPSVERGPLRKGVELGALPGTPVHAAADGTVVYVGYLPGFGRTLILDHGKRLHSVYGQLADVLVAPGAQVAAGDVIGSIGSSGVATRSALYFELREAGHAVDPLRMVGRAVAP